MQFLAYNLKSLTDIFNLWCINLNFKINYLQLTLYDYVKLLIDTHLSINENEIISA